MNRPLYKIISILDFSRPNFPLENPNGYLRRALRKNRNPIYVLQSITAFEHCDCGCTETELNLDREQTPTVGE